jgi:hypothetical protein
MQLLGSVHQNNGGRRWACGCGPQRDSGNLGLELSNESLELGRMDFNFLTMYVVMEVVVALLWWNTWLYAIATND